jgi:hypothetical protein
MDMEIFSLKKLNEEEVKEQYQVTIKNKFSALENFIEEGGYINRAWDTIKREHQNFDQREYCEVVVNQSMI